MPADSMPTALTPQEVAELRRLMVRASNLPWAVYEPPTGRLQIIADTGRVDVADIGKVLDVENAQLIAAAVNALPRLLAELAALRKVAEEAAEFATAYDRHMIAGIAHEPLMAALRAAGIEKELTNG